MLTENPVVDLDDTTMNTISCPRCGSTDVRASQRRAIRLFHTTYRCRACKRHFRFKTLRQKVLLSALIWLGGLALATLTLMWALEPGTPAAPEQTAVAVQPELAQDLALAKKGDGKAEARLGLYYWNRGDFRRAFPWLERAGPSDPEAKYYLGLAYLDGRGTVQNYRFAFDRFLETAKLGNIEAQYHLGLLYRDGMGVEKSKESAYTWLNVAAARGHALASEIRDRLSDLMSKEEIARAQEASMQEINRLKALHPAVASDAAEPEEGGE
jgi:uncharacterized protein